MLENCRCNAQWFKFPHDYKQNNRESMSSGDKRKQVYTTLWSASEVLNHLLSSIKLYPKQKEVKTILPHQRCLKGWIFASSLSIEVCKIHKCWHWFPGLSVLRFYIKSHYPLAWALLTKKRNVYFFGRNSYFFSGFFVFSHLPCQQFWVISAV